VLDADFEQIRILEDAPARCVAIVAIHSTRCGPAFGGIRRWRYATRDEAVADARRLARAMTWKAAVAGVAGGGGKTVVMDHAQLDRTAAYRLVGRHVESLGGRYYTGPDVGTDDRDLEEVGTQTRYVALPGLRGPGDLAASTALGVCAGIEAVAVRLGFDGLRGLHVAVQGLGEVGWRLAALLAEGGARLTVADPRAERAQRAARDLAAAVVPPERVVGAPCDVLAPCALGGVIDDAALAVLRARAVAGSANNVLAAPRHGAALAARGVLFAPDFVINAGALIHGAAFHLEGRSPPPERIRALGAVVGEILDRAAADGTPPEVHAERLARERLARCGA
jgi:leucine dehydrogenase